MQSAEDLRLILTTVIGHVTAADQKAAALLAIAGVLVAFPTPWILAPSTPSSVPAFSTVCSAISAWAFVFSIIGALMVLFPRTKNDTNTSSLIYFGDIGASTHADYVAALARADDARVRDDLIAQIHINARIASSKHGHFKLAVASLITGIVLLSLSYVGIAITVTNRSTSSVAAHGEQTQSK